MHCEGDEAEIVLDSPVVLGYSPLQAGLETKRNHSNSSVNSNSFGTDCSNRA